MQGLDGGPGSVQSRDADLEKPSAGKVWGVVWVRDPVSLIDKNR